MALSPLIPVLHADSTTARFGRNWAAFNSPSWLGEGWRVHPCPRPQFRILASLSAVTGVPQVILSG